MQGKIIAKISNSIINFFNKVVNRISKQVNFIKRPDKTKITPESFSKVLLLGYLSDTRISLQGLCQLFKQEKIEVSKQAVHERFNSAAVEFLKGLFQEACQQFKIAQNTVIELLQPFTSVKNLDSSTISLPSHMKELYNGCGGVGSESALKMQTTFDYANGQIDEIVFTDGRKNDQSFKDYLEHLEEGALYLQDLGYFSAESFDKIHKMGAYFISRLFTQTAIYDINGVRIDLAKKLKEFDSFFTMDVLLSRVHQVPVRLIVQKLSEEQAATSARKIIKNAKKHGKTPTKETLEFAAWSICVTNISEEKLKAEQIYQLYTVRWQIELFFKLCKQEAGVDKNNSVKKDRILCEIYAKLIGITMMLYMCWPVRWEIGGERELSFQKAYNFLRKQISIFFIGLGSLYRLKRFLNTFLDDLKRFAMKDLRRKRPATHQKLMNCTGQKILVEL